VKDEYLRESEEVKKLIAGENEVQREKLYMLLNCRGNNSL